MHMTKRTTRRYGRAGVVAASRRSPWTPAQPLLRRIYGGPARCRHPRLNTDAQLIFYLRRELTLSVNIYSSCIVICRTTAQQEQWPSGDGGQANTMTTIVQHNCR